MKYNTTIKLIGIFLLVSGWFIVVTALAMLRRASSESAFMLAGGAVEGVGAALLFLAHRNVRGDR